MDEGNNAPVSQSSLIALREVLLDLLDGQLPPEDVLEQFSYETIRTFPGLSKRDHLHIIDQVVEETFMFAPASMNRRARNNVIPFPARPGLKSEGKER